MGLGRKSNNLYNVNGILAKFIKLLLILFFVFAFSNSSEKVILKNEELEIEREKGTYSYRSQLVKFRFML